MNTTAKQLRIQLLGAIISVFVTVAAISSAAYAWYVSNTTVTGTASTISAMANNFVLQIGLLENGAQHGDNNQSLQAEVLGGKISPSSTSNMKDWYVCNEWKTDGLVHSYMIPSDIDSKGKYVGTDGEHYAFLCGEYILYTITETGTCDVYLSPDDLNKYITVTQTAGEEKSTTIPGSIRVGITTQKMKADGSGVDTTQPEKLVLVYAPQNETGKGNDSGAMNGWTCVKDHTSLMTVPYTYIYGTETQASDGKTYVAEKEGDDYSAPAVNGAAIASDVGYNGVAMRVYIWLEGTDAECVNTNGEADDMSTYSVVLTLAGVAK